jgi:hypothetical protein
LVAHGGSRSHTHAMPIRMLALTVAALALVACGSADGGDQPAQADGSAPILLDGANGPMFYPRDVPAGTMSAQVAYNAMRRQGHRPPRPIPANVTPRFGLLTQSDTQPSAYRMPVWAFTFMGCQTSGAPTPAPTCVYWVFARASDGKDLGVGDPQNIS